MPKHIWLCGALMLLAACAPAQNSPVNDQRNKTLLELLNDPSQAGRTFFEEVRVSLAAQPQVSEQASKICGQMNVLRSVKAALVFGGSVDQAQAMLSTALHDASGVPYLKTDWRQLYDNFHAGVTGQSTALPVPRAGAHPDERVVISVIPAQEAGLQTAICLRLDAPPR